MRLCGCTFSTSPSLPSPALLRDTGSPIFSGATSISPSHPCFSSLCSYPIQRRLFISSSSQVKTASQPKREAATEDVPLGFYWCMGSNAANHGPLSSSLRRATSSLLLCGAPASTRHRLPPPNRAKIYRRRRREKMERLTLQMPANPQRQQREHVSNWVIKEPGTIIFATILGPL